MQLTNQLDNNNNKSRCFCCSDKNNYFVIMIELIAYLIAIIMIVMRLISL